MSNISHLYKVFDSTSAYIGILDPLAISSDFKLSQDLNDGGGEIQIELGDTLDDTGATITSDIITDENAANLVDDLGQNILASEAFNFATVPIDLANRIDVYQYDSHNINGTRVFSGIITSWKASYKDAKMTVTVQSFSVQLDQVQLGFLAGAKVVSQEITDGEADLYMPLRTGGPTAIYQTFQVATPITVSNFQIYMRCDVPIYSYFQLWKGTPAAPDSFLGSSSVYVANTTLQYGDVSLSAPVDLLAGTTYFWGLALSVGAGGNLLHLGTNSAGGYADGNMYTRNYAGVYTSVPGTDTAFRVLSSNQSLTTIYGSYDPAAIMRNALNLFNQRAGIVTYDSTTLELTSTSVSYTFRTSTILDVIKKCLELAPSNWYWYVDPGENKLHFHQRRQVYTHKFVLGKHLEDIELEYTLDNMKNYVVFSGGNAGSGTNIATINSDAASINNYGVWLENKVDNRVTLTTTANTLSLSILSQNSEPTFRTNITILASQYDILTIKLGDMVAFGNFNSLVNSLLLQVVHITRYPDMVKLGLATNPPVVAHRIEDIKRNLDNLYTIANPDTIV